MERKQRFVDNRIICRWPLPPSCGESTPNVKTTGLNYLRNFVLPNFFFHMTMTYALLRKNGVELGKRDFLGA